jgi:hypothetical protein
MCLFDDLKINESIIKLNNPSRYHQGNIFKSPHHQIFKSRWHFQIKIMKLLKRKRV